MCSEFLLGRTTDSSKAILLHPTAPKRNALSSQRSCTEIVYVSSLQMGSLFFVTPYFTNDTETTSPALYNNFPTTIQCADNCRPGGGIPCLLPSPLNSKQSSPGVGVCSHRLMQRWNNQRSKVLPPHTQEPERMRQTLLVWDLCT